jgi:hypothetical protein
MPSLSLLVLPDELLLMIARQLITTSPKFEVLPMVNYKPFGSLSRTIESFDRFVLPLGFVRIVLGAV